jgi:stress response protein YsnF
VKKHQTQDTERVEADLRRERADIEGADETTRNRGRDKR